METSYTMAPNPPPAMSWDEYEKILGHEWSTLLDSDKQNDESAFQDYLERHPCLLPHPYACFSRGAHLPLYAAIVTQPELPGARPLRPDFMWLAVDSGAVIAVLIEIEAPAKRWSNRDGSPTSEFVHAHDQLRQWKAWFDEPHNIITFQKLYKIPDEYLQSRKFMQRYVLIYGRRTELDEKPSFSKKREGMTSENELLMTFDRLSPSANQRNIVTIRLDRSAPDTNFSLLHIPPTYQHGPLFAHSLSKLKNREAAINGNNLISPERKRFLVDRLAYWDTWANRPPTSPFKLTISRGERE